MNRPNGGLRRAEHGAVAVFVAILATLLMAMAAISVDLGNAWARKRAVQTQVDVSAMSAGHLLPQTAANTDEIVDQVADYLNRDHNQVYGQPDVNATQLQDGALSNGEVIFSNGGARMRVIAPGAHVDFKFASAMSHGTDVRAEATVEVQSPLPPGGKVLPFAMPDQCPFGPAMADTGPGGPNGPDTSGTFDPTNDRNGHLVSITPDETTTDSTGVTMTVVMNDLPNNASSAVIQFRAGANTVHSVTATWTPDTTNSDDSRTFDIAVPDEVLAAPLDWIVWGYVKNKHTDNSLTFTVGEGSTPATSEVSCVSSASGEFGQMYSPRGNAAADQRGLALNIALGLDHDLYPWLKAPEPECGKKTQAPPAGGSQDEPSSVKPNCILPQTGNDGPWMLKGLVTGLEGTAGRLDANANGHTKSGCGADVIRESVLINNDRLSCYLKDGYSLDDLAQDAGVSEEMLDPSVVDSPRFVWIPVIHAQQRADIDNNTFYAIKRFVPGFITDETRLSSDTFSDATADNGVVISGQLEAIQVFMFNALALPIDERSPTVEYDPELGKVIRLVD